MYVQSQIRCLRLYPLTIRLKRPFRHAAHIRQDADPIVFEVELADGTLGYGETLPREYVSGETTGSVVRVVKETLLDELLNLRPARFAEVLESIDALPIYSTAGEPITAARAGLELALLDAYSHHFSKPISEVAGWFGVPGFGEPGSITRVRYSGVLSGDEPRKLKRSATLMRWYGLRDLKLKVGYPDDTVRIQAAAAGLGRSLGRSTTLRLDANGAWTLERAIEVMTSIEHLPVRYVEQPFPRGRDGDVLAFQATTGARVIADESLVTPDDAEHLRRAAGLTGLNIRISKNGGFLPALRLAHLARRHELMYQLGCLVGETSILSAVGRRFIESVPSLTFAEGSYGRFLLTADVTDRPVRFGYGGRPKPLPGLGWGVSVRRDLLERYAHPGVVEFPL